MPPLMVRLRIRYRIRHCGAQWKVSPDAELGKSDEGELCIPVRKRRAARGQGNR